MKMSKGLSKLIAVLMLAAMFAGTIGAKKADAATNYLVQAKATGRYDFNIEPGEKKHVVIPVKAADVCLNIRSMSAEASTPDITISNVTIKPASSTVERDSDDGIAINDGSTYNLEFDASASDTLTIGYNTISINGSGSGTEAYNYNSDIFYLNNELLITLTSYTATELNPVEIVVNKVTYPEKQVTPGAKFTMKVELKNIGDRQALNAYLSMNFGGSGIVPTYKVENIKVGNILPGGTASVDVPVEVLKNAEAGFYEITANITCKDIAGTVQGPFSRNLYITVIKPEDAEVKKGKPNLAISTTDNYKVFAPDSEQEINVKIRNTGDADAKDVRLSVISGLESSIGLTKRFTSEYLSAGTIKKGEETSISVPIKVAKTFEAGLYEIQMSVSCKDEDNNEVSPVNMTVYVKGTEKSQESPVESSISLSTTDNYKTLKPDSNVNIKVTVKNTGKTDVKNVILNVVSGLDISAGLTKAFTTDGISVGDLKAGASKAIDVPIRVAKSFSAGLYELQMTADYRDSKNNEKTSSHLTMYVKGEEKQGEKAVESSIVLTTEDNYAIFKPDSDQNIRVTVENNGKTEVSNVKVDVVSGLEASIGLTKAYTSAGIPVGTLKAGEKKTIKIPVRVAKGFAPGLYEIQIAGTYKDLNKEEKISSNLTMYVKCVEKATKPVQSSVALSTPDNYTVCDPDTERTLKVTVKNNGKTDIKDASLKVLSGLDISIGLTKGYTTDGIAVGNLKAGAQKSIEIPIKVSKNFAAGLYEIQMAVTYKDSQNTEMTSGTLTMYVKGVEKEVKPVDSSIVLNTNSNYAVFEPDTERNINVTVKNNGKTDVTNVKVNVVSGLEASTGLTKAYTTDGISVGSLKAGAEKTVKIPVKVSKNFGSGIYEIQMNASYIDSQNTEKNSPNMTMYIIGPDEKEKEAGRSSVYIGNVSQSPDNPVAGENVTVGFDVINDGTTAIANVKVAGTGLSSSGFEPVSSDPYKKVGNIAAGSRSHVTMVFKVGKDIPSGFNILNITCEYIGESGMSASESAGLYILNVINELKGENGEQKTSRPKLIISSYSAEPVFDESDLAEDTEEDDMFDDGDMGGDWSLYDSSSMFESSDEMPKIFKGAGAFSDGMTYGDIGEPVYSEDLDAVYDSPDYADMADPGEDYSDPGEDYSDPGEDYSNPGEDYSDPGEDYSDPGEGYDDGASMGDDYENDTDDAFNGQPEPRSRELKAGKEFDFSYTLKNTHTSKAAKNIKITLEQVEGVFIPVEGSNIFYIDAIEAGETNVQTIRMKTRSDVATGDYNISIKVEYEYDDMSDVDRERGGVVDENNIKLHAVENYRPEIENISIDAYEGIRVGMPVDLNFEFYNMGKSTLGNVYVTIEGDFELANGSSKTYVGAVNGYSQEFVNPQVVPLATGPVTGIIVVHFEDSNGDEQTKRAKFSAYVMDEDGGGDYIPDYGDMSGGYYNPDFPDDYDPDAEPGMDEGEEGSGKILGLPTWLFITICSVLGAAVIVIIVVVVVKKKRKKALLDEDDE